MATWNMHAMERQQEGATPKYLSRHTRYCTFQNVVSQPLSWIGHVLRVASHAPR